jgi:hypothetical protein
MDLVTPLRSIEEIEETFWTTPPVSIYPQI